MARDHAAVQNLHVAAHTTADSITMLYNVRPGACDRSYGIHVAEVVGFPPAVLEGAKRKVKEFERASYFDFGEDGSGKSGKSSSSSSSSGGGGGGGGGGSVSPKASADKQRRAKQLSASEHARLVAFVKEFRALDRADVEGGKGKAMVAAFRSECTAAPGLAPLVAAAAATAAAAALAAGSTN
jgi:DNA mismatch repair ATPase MutS